MRRVGAPGLQLCGSDSTNGSSVHWARGCLGVSGANPVLLGECSIPIPIPIPIPTRAARRCRVGSSSTGGVSGWDVGNGHDGHRGGLSDSCSGALSRGVAAIGCWRSGEGVLSPLWGWAPINPEHTRLTPWATVFRPSGPGATAWARGWLTCFVSLVSFVEKHQRSNPCRGAEPADASTPPGLVSVSHGNPGCASRPRAVRCNPFGIGRTSRRSFIGIDPDPDPEQDPLAPASLRRGAHGVSAG